MDIDPRLALFTGDTGGIDSWLTSDNSDLILQRLAQLPAEPVSHSLLNQLLGLSEQPGFPKRSLTTTGVPFRGILIGSSTSLDSRSATPASTGSKTIEQLQWGLYRIYVDCLLYFGTIRNGFYILRDKDATELAGFFTAKMYDADGLASRGQPIAPIPIPIDDRYLMGNWPANPLSLPNLTKTYGTRFTAHGYST